MINLQPGDFIGITGIIGSGKSFFAESFLANKNKLYSNINNTPINIFEIDDIRRELLWSSTCPLSLRLRQLLIQEFSISSYNFQLFFDRESFTNLIFSNHETLQHFNNLCKPFFIEYIKESIQEKSANLTINLVVWVNLLEDEYITDFKFNHIFFTKMESSMWETKNSHFVKERLQLQNNEFEKIKLLEKSNIPFSIINYE